MVPHANVAHAYSLPLAGTGVVIITFFPFL